MEPRVKTIILDRDHLPSLDETDATGTSEVNFERTALRLLQRIHSNCHVFDFKPVIDYAGTGWKPDLALVDKNMGFWYIIEVETASHSLQRHVFPQVEGFQYGEHGESSIAKLSESLQVSREQAATLIKYVPSYVAVVSNAYDEEWDSALTARNVQYISMAAFQDEQGVTAHLVTGVLRPAERSLCFGTVYPAFQAIRVNRTEFWKETTYRITDFTGTGNWECKFAGEYAWLAKKKGVLVMDGCTHVQFLQRDDQSIVLRAL